MFATSLVVNSCFNSFLLQFLLPLFLLLAPLWGETSICSFMLFLVVLPLQIISSCSAKVTLSSIHLSFVLALHLLCLLYIFSDTLKQRQMCMLRYFADCWRCTHIAGSRHSNAVEPTLGSPLPFSQGAPERPDCSRLHSGGCGRVWSHLCRLQTTGSA